MVWRAKLPSFFLAPNTAVELLKYSIRFAMNVHISLGGLEKSHSSIFHLMKSFRLFSFKILDNTIDTNKYSK